MTEPKTQPYGDLMEGKLQGRGFTALRTFLFLLFRILFGLKMHGLNNIPKEGGLLVVSNHLHNADPVLISTACTRPIHYMAKKELMTIPVVGQVDPVWRRVPGRSREGRSPGDPARDREPASGDRGRNVPGRYA